MYARQLVIIRNQDPPYRYLVMTEDSKVKAVVSLYNILLFLSQTYDSQVNLWQKDHVCLFHGVKIFGHLKWTENVNRINYTQWTF